MDASALQVTCPKVKVHVKNYRPNYLILCGSVKDRLPLVLFGNQLRKGKVIIGTSTTKTDVLL